MFDINTYRSGWEGIGDTLYVYKVTDSAIAQTDERTRFFLSQCGLPTSCSPFLSFDTIEDADFPTVNNYFNLCDKKLNRYLVFGANGNGDSICIDTQNGCEVVYLNHDDRFARIFINRDIESFGSCLLLFNQFVKTLITESISWRKFSDDEFNALSESIRSLDDQSLIGDTFWTGALEELLWERENG